MEQENKSKSSKLYLIIIIIILLILNGVFIYNFYSTDEKLVVTKEELVSTEKDKMNLEKLLGEMDEQLSQFKGKNAQLDAFLKQKNDSLQELAEKIENILRKGKITASELAKAREELDVLRYYKNKYLSQIDSLSTVVTNLTEQNQGLRQNIDQQKRRNENLTLENVKLNNKVSIGSKLLAENIYITGIKTRSNGKERETNRVNRLERLKVTFRLAQNLVADQGEREIYMKVLSPEGSTLYIETAGSGEFEFEGSKALYSTKKIIEYDNEAQDISIYWEKGSPFKAGQYKLELYTDGALIGNGEFELN